MAINRTSARAFEWDRATLTPAEVRVHLSEAALAELRRATELASLNHEGAADLLPAFPALARDVETIRQERIENAPGFCIIDGASLQSLAMEACRGAYFLIARMLGSLLKQNAAGDRIVEVFDRGQPLAAGGRYHQTAASGVLHSDSPQWPDVPDYVALLCVRAAKHGGASKFISGYSVLKRLQDRVPHLVDELNGSFLFDKRGDFAAGEPPVTTAPIFRWQDSELHFRYLRAYIDSGHRRLDMPLTERQTRTLDEQDAVLLEDDLVVTEAMVTGDVQILNNHFVVHDRWPFEDYADPERRRLMLRAWLRRP